MRDSTDCSDQLILDWVKITGGVYTDIVNDVTTDNAGNIYVVGSYSIEMDFQSISLISNGFKDYFLAKLDSNGNLIWIISNGGSEDDEATGIALDDVGNIYITGNFSGTVDFGSDQAISNGNKDIFLIKYNNNGIYQWGKFMGGFDDDIAGDVCVDYQNNPAITGTYDFAMSINGTSSISKGLNDFFIAKYNSNGDFQWITAEGSTQNDSGVKLTSDNLGNFYVTGDFSGILNFGPVTLTAEGFQDVFLAKYTSNGSFDWALKLGTSGDDDIAGDVVCDFNNKVYVLYKSDQIVDNAQVSVYNSGGFLNASFGFGGNGSVNPKGIAVDNSNNIYISGIYSSPTDFGDGVVVNVGDTDYFVTKYKSNGNFDFKGTAGSLFADGAMAICLDNNNNIIVGGFCNNNIYFDGTPYSAQSKDDALIVKYNSYFSFSQIITSSINCNPNNLCIDIEVSGGTAPFNYYLNNMPSSSNVCGLSVGNHQIIVTDANDCYIETTISLSAPTATPINIPSTITACFHDTIVLDATSNYVDYLWSTPDAESTQTIEVYDGGNYTVSVTDANSCTTSATVFVNELPDKNLFVVHELFLCPRESISVQVAGYSNYLWFDGSNSASYSFTEGGEYWLQAYDGSCWYYDTLTIILYPQPNVNIGSDINICAGDNIEIDAGSGFVSYLWQDNSTNETYWASETGPVSVVVTDNNGCTTSDAITVTSIPVEDINLGKDTTVCTNEPYILDPNDTSPNNTYLWNTGETSNTLSVSNTNQYWIQVTNFAGCISSDTITVTIFPQPILELGEDISFCEGDSDTIKLTEIYHSYEWSTGATDNYLFVDSSGIYYLTVTDINGCSDKDFIYVTENIIQPPFLGFDTTLCEGDVYILEPEGLYYSYKWNNGSTIAYQTVTIPGFFSLTVSDAIGCTASSSINIDFADVPVILNAISGGGEIVIDVTGGTQPYLYSHDGDTWQTSNIFDQLPSDYYSIAVMDKNYCMDTIDTYLDATIKIPAFFTPNGDGYNDYWVIFGLYQFPEAIVQIFDRYGKKIYEFTNNVIGWDGTYVGLPVPSDTYWYSIILEKGREPLTGHVTIKR